MTTSGKKKQKLNTVYDAKLKVTGPRDRIPSLKNNLPLLSSLNLWFYEITFHVMQNTLIIQFFTR